MFSASSHSEFWAQNCIVCWLKEKANVHKAGKLLRCGFNMGIAATIVQCLIGNAIIFSSFHHWHLVMRNKQIWTRSLSIINSTFWNYCYFCFGSCVFNAFRDVFWIASLRSMLRNYPDGTARVTYEWQCGNKERLEELSLEHLVLLQT